MEIAERAESESPISVVAKKKEAEDTFREPPQQQLCFVREEEEVKRSGKEAHTPMKKREIYKSIII